MKAHSTTGNEEIILELVTNNATTKVLTHQQEAELDDYLAQAARLHWGLVKMMQGLTNAK